MLDGIERFGGQVRQALGLERMGYGLWLSRSALDECNVGQLRTTLDRAGLFVFTINGFPYGNFHQERVKHDVYDPDWSDERRLHFSLELAEVLAALLPDDLEHGTISTLPIGHNTRMSASAVPAALDMLCRTAAGLAELHARTGKSIRLCIEPEPGCVVETTAQATNLFTSLIPAAAKRTGVSREIINEHLGLCYDTCHQAIAFEDAAASIAALTEAGVCIGKVQLSSAIALDPSNAQARAELAAFDEPRFLHQVRTQTQGELAGVDDLPEVTTLPSNAEWRVHFHVPIHRELAGETGALRTTRGFMIDVVNELRGAQTQSPCFEVETYTWSVLPEAERPQGDRGLIEGIAAELRFAQELLQ